MANGFDISQNVIHLWRTFLIESNVTTEYDLLAIYGVGTSGAWLLRLLNSKGLNNSVFIEDDIRKVGYFFQDRPVISLEKLKLLKTKKIVLVSLDEKSTSKILDILRREEINAAYFNFTKMRIVLP